MPHPDSPHCTCTHSLAEAQPGFARESSVHRYFCLTPHPRTSRCPRSSRWPCTPCHPCDLLYPGSLLFLLLKLADSDILCALSNLHSSPGLSSYIIWKSTCSFCSEVGSIRHFLVRAWQLFAPSSSPVQRSAQWHTQKLIFMKWQGCDRLRNVPIVKTWVVLEQMCM